MTYTIEDIRTEYERLDHLCNLDTSTIEIRLNNAKKRLGCFSVERKDPSVFLSLFSRPRLTITISRAVMTDDKLFYDTIRHEYAHAVVYLRHPYERHAHDAVWKAVCREVGCTPRATVKDSVYSDRMRQKSNYTVECRKCGAASYYQRAGKIVKALQLNPDRTDIRCRKCGGTHFVLK